MTSWEQKMKYTFAEVSVEKEEKSSGHIPLLSVLVGNE